MIKLERVVRCLGIDQSEESAFAAPVKNTISKAAVDLGGYIGTSIIDGDSALLVFGSNCRVVGQERCSLALTKTSVAP